MIKEKKKVKLINPALFNNLVISKGFVPSIQRHETLKLSKQYSVAGYSSDGSIGLAEGEDDDDQVRADVTPRSATTTHRHQNYQKVLV